MTDTTKFTPALDQLRSNRIDLTAAIADALATFDPRDPRHVEHLSGLSSDYRITIALLAFHESPDLARAT